MRNLDSRSSNEPLSPLAYRSLDTVHMALLVPSGQLMVREGETGWSQRIAAARVVPEPGPRRAKDGIRTRDPHLGKQVVSYHEVRQVFQGAASSNPVASPSIQFTAVVERSKCYLPASLTSHHSSAYHEPLSP